MDIEEPEFTVLRTEPSTSASRRRKRAPKELESLLNFEPVVSSRKKARVQVKKKRGSSVRVTIRKQLKARRKQLRRNFFAMKRQYRIKKARLDRDINSLIVRKAQPK